MARFLRASWRQTKRLAVVLFFLMLIALTVPVAALLVQWVRPKRNLPAQVKKEE